MSLFVYFGKRGSLRLYSGASDGLGGRYYFEVPFVNMDFNTTAGRPRPDEIPVMDRGILNSYSHHIQGPDVPIIQPVQLTFTCLIDNTVNRFELRNAMGNLDRNPTWTVNGTTWSNVNGTTLQLNGFGAAVSTPLPYDTEHDRINISMLWYGDPHIASGTDDSGLRLNETWFQPGQVRIAESPTAVTMNATGWIYGAICSISAHAAGTNVAPTP